MKCVIFAETIINMQSGVTVQSVFIHDETDPLYTLYKPSGTGNVCWKRTHSIADNITGAYIM